MKTITNYIIHRSIDMNQLVAMVTESMGQGYQPYGDLVAVPVKTNAIGTMDLAGTHANIAYIQAMVQYAADND
jgi:hypothetical protein